MKLDSKWMKEVPITIGECHEALERENNLVTDCLRGAFDCRIGQGDTVMKA